MEGVAPPLRFLMDLRWSIETGHSVNQGIRIYLERYSDEFTLRLKAWFLALQSGQRHADLLCSFPTIYQRALVDLCYAGLQGTPILEKLQDLEEELQQACERDLERHLSCLPFITMIPLLLLQFPAFLLLLLGPMLSDLIIRLGGNFGG